MLKWIRILFGFLIIAVVSFPVIVNARQTDNVKDYMNFLSDEQLSSIQKDINILGDSYKLDIAIVITNDTKGKSSRSFADDFYDNNGYGYGEDHSGLLMLINMKDREIWISTTGKAIGIYTDNRISTMVNNVTPYLSAGKYNDACKVFLNDIKVYADNGIPNNNKGYSDKGVPGNQYRADENGVRSYNTDTKDTGAYLNKALRLMKSPFVYIIAIMISLIATIIITVSNKGRVTINNQTYEEKGSFMLKDSKDIYLRNTVTRTRIQTNNNGGGSSTHMGSSGRSHGGGGGKF